MAAVLVVADDLIWADRLVIQARGAGAEAVAVSRPAALEGALEAGPDLVVVDLSVRSFDAVEVIARAAAAGVTVLGVGQHDERESRSRALAAGARRVYAYAKMHADGAAVLSRWLAASTAPGSAGR